MLSVYLRNKISRSSVVSLTLRDAMILSMECQMELSYFISSIDNHV
jgi:hypothetical protein